MDSQLLQIQLYLEGRLSASQARQLTERLNQDPDALRQFTETCRLAGRLAQHYHHSSLRESCLSLLAQEAQRPSQAVPSVDAQTQPQPASRFARSWRQLRETFRTPTAVALLLTVLFHGCLLFGFAVWHAPEWRRPAHPAPSPTVRIAARLTQLQDAVWRQDAAWTQGADLPEGATLSLQSGMAEILFLSGARVLLEGPGEFQLENDNHGRLRVGQLTAVVGREARGFAIDTPSATIVDLGTEFDVRVDEQGATDTVVFSGEIEVSWQSDRALETARRTLRAGEGLQIASQGSRVTPVDVATFVRPARWQALEPTAEPTPTEYTDDFSSSSPDRYVVTDAFGSGGVMEIAGGVMHLRPAVRNTMTVMLRGEPGDSLGLYPGMAVEADFSPRANGSQFLTVSTAPLQPHCGGAAGFRLRRDATGLKVSTYLPGCQELRDTDTIADPGGPMTLGVERPAAGRFLFYVRQGEQRTELAEIEAEKFSSEARLYIGVQGWCDKQQVVHEVRELRILLQESPESEQP
ncbi:MAG: FecR family protein [Pirellulales bacterium]